jgi:uncharacterized protein (TIGR03435 family)
LVKFLLPFSLLLALGTALAPQRTSGTELQPVPFYRVDAASQPFTYTQPALSAPVKIALQDHVERPDRIAFVLAAIWAVGFLIVIGVWLAGWRQVAAILRNSHPDSGGRENAILGRIRERMRIKSPVALLVSQSAMEPGVIGIFHSMLLWPNGISESLGEDQVEAIIAHELAHVSRRDNLTAALAMFCTAIFWFHPLAWWMKARAMDMRERACDEAVILFGNRPEVYASSILRACEFSIDSPLASVSGITGSDLKERVRRIMCDSPLPRLSRSMITLLAGIAATAVLAPIGFGFLDVPRASAALMQDTEIKPAFTFEVATIKPTKDPGGTQRSLMLSPGRFQVTNMPLRDVIMFAYDAKSEMQVSGYPAWVASTHYDIGAKEDVATAAALGKMTGDERSKQIKLMMQALLEDRLQLKVSRTMKEIPVYALVFAKGGPRLTPSVAPPSPPSGVPTAEGRKTEGGGFRITGDSGKIEAINATLDSFARVLSNMPETEDRVVINKTGLTGKYDFKLNWTPERRAGGAVDPGPSSSFDADSRPGLFTALEEELGLKLESQKGSVEVLVVDHVEPPSSN